MPLVRAMRLINALEAGTLDAAGLTTLLNADPSRVNELSAMLGMRGQVLRLLNSTGAATALLQGSTPALRGTLAHNDQFMAGVVDRPALWGAAVQGGYAPVLWALLGSSDRMAVVDASADLSAAVYGAQIGGGYLACVHTAGGNRYAVIQAPKDSGEAQKVWKDAATASAGAGSLDFGLANANAQNNANHPLFLWARALTIGGYTDWAPPAENVALAIAARMRPGVAQNNLFKAGGAQVYVANVYWTATGDATTARNCNFSTGVAVNGSKTTNSWARVVRMVQL